MLRRRVLQLLASAVLLTLLTIATSLPARADNCGSLSDCFGTTEAAIAALVAAAILAGILVVALPALLAAAAEAATLEAAEAAALAAAEAEAEAAAEVAATEAEAEAAAAEAEAEAEAAESGNTYPDPSNLENQTARTYAEKMENSIDDHLTSDDLQGAWRDLHGDPVPDPNNPGEFYDHLGEVNDAMRSLRNAVEEFKDLLNNRSLSSSDRSIVQNLLSRASKTLDYVEKVITRDQWFPGTKVPPF